MARGGKVLSRLLSGRPASAQARDIESRSISLRKWSGQPQPGRRAAKRKSCRASRPQAARRFRHDKSFFWWKGISKGTYFFFSLWLDCFSLAHSFGEIFIFFFSGWPGKKNMKKCHCFFILFFGSVWQFIFGVSIVFQLPGTLNIFTCGFLWLHIVYSILVGNSLVSFSWN